MYHHSFQYALPLLHSGECFQIQLFFIKYLVFFMIPGRRLQQLLEPSVYISFSTYITYTCDARSKSVKPNL